MAVKRQAVLNARANFNRGTGNLFRSIDVQPLKGRGIHKSVRVKAGGDFVPYARMQEKGSKPGGLKPKKGKYLAIPIGKAKTKRGVGRGTPREFPNTFVKKSKKGNLIIFQKKSFKKKKPEIEPLFVLKKSVKIPKRPYLSKALRQKRKTILSFFKRGIRLAIREAGFKK